MYKLIIRPFLFLFDPEAIHDFIITILKFFQKIYPVRIILRSQYNYENNKLHREIIGLKFKNPVGLAAGFDKNAEVFESLADFGFGFIEIGTVTPKSQPGNPKPRLFRLKNDGSILNRMGFNNDGIEYAIKNLKKRKNQNVIIGGNIGKNKITSLENAAQDYLVCFDQLYPYVDYFAINISSPNTPDLRKLQEKSNLENLFRLLLESNSKKPKPKPVLVKIAPDLNEDQLADIIDIVNNYNIDGIIATNTTIDKSNIDNEIYKIPDIGNGGISGKLLKTKSDELILKIRQKLNTNKIIIGVGGISNPQDAIDKLNAGADLIQIYTGFIYEGPAIVKKINKLIADKD